MTKTLPIVFIMAALLILLAGTAEATTDYKFVMGYTRTWNNWEDHTNTEKVGQAFCLNQTIYTDRMAVSLCREAGTTTPSVRISLWNGTIPAMTTVNRYQLLAAVNITTATINKCSASAPYNMSWYNITFPSPVYLRPSGYCGGDMAHTNLQWYGAYFIAMDGFVNAGGDIRWGRMGNADAPQRLAQAIRNFSTSSWLWYVNTNYVSGVTHGFAIYNITLPPPAALGVAWANMTRNNTQFNASSVRIMGNYTADTGKLVNLTISNGTQPSKYNPALAACSGQNILLPCTMKGVNLTKKFMANFTQQGTYKIIFNATDGSGYALSQRLYFTLNHPPSVVLGNLRIGSNKYALAPGLKAVFAAANFSFNSSVSDSQGISRVSYIVRNRSDTVLFNYTAAAVKNPINVSWLKFVDFSWNPFNYSIRVRDSSGFSVFASTVFNVTDTTAPVLSGAGSSTHVNLTYFKHNITVTDAYLWSFNISCDDGRAYFKDAIAAQSFNWLNYTNLTTPVTCVIEACDGHTADAISLMPVSSDTSKGILSIGTAHMAFSSPIEAFKTTKETDRYSFDVTFKTPRTEFNVVLGGEWKQARNSPHKGHYVNTPAREWLDFEGGTWTAAANGDIVTITSDKPLTTFSFSSVGKLNCVNTTQILNITGIPPPTITIFTPADGLVDTNIASFYPWWGVSQESNCSLLIDGVYNRSIWCLPIPDNDCHFGVTDFPFHNGTKFEWQLQCKNRTTYTSPARNWSVNVPRMILNIAFPPNGSMQNTTSIDFLATQSKNVFTYDVDCMLYINGRVNQTKVHSINFDPVPVSNKTRLTWKVNCTYDWAHTPSEEISPEWEFNVSFIPITTGSYNYNQTIPNTFGLTPNAGSTAGVLLLFFWLAVSLSFLFIGITLQEPVIAIFSAVSFFVLGFVVVFTVSALLGILLIFFGAFLGVILLMAI